MTKNVIITGATGNLGKATVEKLLNDNCHVIALTAPDQGKGFYDNDSRVEKHEVDLQDEVGTESILSLVAKNHGTLHAALLLAGGYSSGTIADTTGNNLKKMFALNFETSYNVARAVFNQMMTQDSGGRIVFIGARPALNASEGINSLGYGLSKSLVVKLSEYLNAAGSGKNVVSSVIIPSTLDTQTNRQAMPKADFSKWVKPGEIADAMLYLISDNASSLREPLIKMYGGS